MAKGQATQTEIEIATSLSQKSWLRGALDSATPVADPKTGERRWTAIVRYGEVLVAIPSNYYDSSFTGQDYPLIGDKMRSRIDSPVWFVVMAMDYATKSAVGSRVMAEEGRRRLWYKEDTPLKEGGTVTGEIVAIMKSGVIVNISGFESEIVNKYLAHEFIKDGSDLFKVGDSVKVKLLRIKKDEKGNIRGFVGSRKATYENPLIKRAERITEGLHRGVVTGTRINKDGRASLFVVKDGVSILCRPPARGYVPYIGDEVDVNVYKKDTVPDEDGQLKPMLWGSILPAKNTNPTLSFRPQAAQIVSPYGGALEAPLEAPPVQKKPAAAKMPKLSKAKRAV